jgi:hypothetical protein
MLLRLEAVQEGRNSPSRDQATLLRRQPRPMTERHRAGCRWTPSGRPAQPVVVRTCEDASAMVDHSSASSPSIDKPRLPAKCRAAATGGLPGHVRDPDLPGCDEGAGSNAPREGQVLDTRGLSQPLRVGGREAPGGSTVRRNRSASSPVADRAHGCCWRSARGGPDRQRSVAVAGGDRESWRQPEVAL